MALQVATPTEPGIHGEMLALGGGGEGPGPRTWTPGEARLDAIIKLHGHQEMACAWLLIRQSTPSLPCDNRRMLPSPRPTIRNFQYFSTFRHRRMPCVPEAHLVLFFQLGPGKSHPESYHHHSPTTENAQNALALFPALPTHSRAVLTISRATKHHHHHHHTAHTLPGQGTALGRTGRSQGAVSPRCLAKPLPWSSPKGSPLARPSSSIRSTPLSPSVPLNFGGSHRLSLTSIAILHCLFVLQSFPASVAPSFPLVCTHPRTKTRPGVVTAAVDWTSPPLIPPYLGHLVVRPDNTRR